MSKILIADDDQNLLEVLKYNLLNEGYNVVTADDGVQAVAVARREKPDLIILDIMLPGLNGLEVCRILRKETATPILMLTAKTEEIDKVVGLEVGADDYVTKPFSLRELMARVGAMLRRFQLAAQPHSPETDAPAILKINDIEVDTSGHRVLRHGTLLKLSPKEFELLTFLMRHAGQVFDRELLLERVWGYDYGGTTRTVDVHIRSLSRKIEDMPEKPKHLITVHSFGYKFEA